MSVHDMFRRADRAEGLSPAPLSSDAGRRRPWLLFAAAGLALVLLGAAYLLHGRAGAAAPVIVTATRGDVEEVVTAIGSLQPVSTVDVGAQVTGQLKKILVHAGDDVAKGAEVAEIDSAIPAAKVDADNAELQNLQAQLADKQSTFILTTAEAERQDNLKRDNATSISLYDNAQAALRSARAQVKALEAQITEAQSTLKADQAQLGYTRINAPISGTVTAIAAKEGQTLNASQTTPTILTISDLTTMTVNTQVSEADVPKLHPGMAVYFTTLGNRRRRYPARLRQILPTPTTVNNVVLYTALFDIPNPDRLLLAQMTAQVFFVLAAAHDVVTIPVSALSFADDADAKAGARKASLTMLLPSGGRENRIVTVGVSNRIHAQILDGLKPGDAVIAGAAQ